MCGFESHSRYHYNKDNRMPKYWVIGTRIEKLGMEIEAASEDEAIQIAKGDPDQFDEFGMDECDADWSFEIEK